MKKFKSEFKSLNQNIQGFVYCNGGDPKLEYPNLSLHCKKKIADQHNRVINELITLSKMCENFESFIFEKQE